MKLSAPTGDQAKAFGRHVATVAATVVGTAATFKIVSGGDAASLQAQLDHISHGVAEIALGVSGMIATLSAVYASLSASPIAQILRGLFAIKSDPAKLDQLKATATIDEKAALVTATNNLDEVKGIPIEPTPAGAALASKVPSPNVAVVRS